MTPEQVTERAPLEAPRAIDIGLSAPGIYNKGSARMFKSDFFERLSHVHPATPAIVFGPVVLFLTVLALRVPGAKLGVVALQLVGGYLAWTVTEYWLHRLLFHLPVVGPKTKAVYFYVHGVHHDWPWDMSRLVIPPGASLVLFVAFYGLFRALFGATGLYAPYAGFVAGYVLYDSVHCWVHARAPKSAFGKWLRREHMVHHFKEPNTRFGVSCPWMDYVFGTTGNRK